MSQTSAIIQYAQMKLRDICKASLGKPIPNWFSIEDMEGFTIRITEGELNLVVAAVVYPVEVAGKDNFLLKVQATFVSKPIIKDGFEFMPCPLGVGIAMDCPLYAETEQELMDGVLQYIYDETNNILEQILE